MSLLCRALVATLLVGMGGGATGASAATVRVTLDAESQSFNEVRYVAAAGEINDLTADYAADARSVTVSDPGAVIKAMGSCRSLSAHAAVCTVRDPAPYPAGPFLQSVRALLGDMDDRALTARTGPYVIGGIDAFGGPGDDALIGSATADVLDGGGGTDVLIGGDGGDVLSDGDRDGAGVRIRPNADILDGGPGLDTLSYSQRSRGVVVDLATSNPVGEPGERDVAPGFESVIGGRGDDHLAGDGDANRLDGGGGRNLLIGRGGDDVLFNASGPRVWCGRGTDHVTGTRARTTVAPSCERLSIRLPRDANVDGGAVVNPTPQREGGALGFDLSCPEIDGYPEDCRTTVHIVARSNHRRLATGQLENSGNSEDTGRFLRVHLTAFGRGLYGDRRRQLATVVVRGPLMARTAWTIWF